MLAWLVMSKHKCVCFYKVNSANRKKEHKKIAKNSFYVLLGLFFQHHCRTFVEQSNFLQNLFLGRKLVLLRNLLCEISLQRIDFCFYFSCFTLHITWPFLNCLNKFVKLTFCISIIKRFLSPLSKSWLKSKTFQKCYLQIIVKSYVKTASKKLKL